MVEGSKIEGSKELSIFVTRPVRADGLERQQMVSTFLQPLVGIDMVFVLDKSGKPLMPCSEKRARLLLKRGRARIHRLVPMVIRLIDRTQDCSELQPLRVKLDPGSKTSGISLVRDTDSLDTCSGEIKRRSTVLLLVDLVHRGRQISESLSARRAMRRRRRANLRYRAPRFLNRGNKGRGWLAPSLQHRVDNSLAWIKRLRHWAPVSALNRPGECCLWQESGSIPRARCGASIWLL
jgi:hypothetical protein